MRSFLPDQQSKALHREIIISYGLNVPKASDSLHKNVPVQLPASHDIKSNDGEARTKKPEKLVMRLLLIVVPIQKHRVRRAGATIPPTGDRRCPD
jgi:hypothetical protein